MAEIAYIDESYDEEFFAMSALIVPVAHWRETFEAIKAHRQRLKAVYGIFTSKELHALEQGSKKAGDRTHIEKAPRQCDLSGC